MDKRLYIMRGIPGSSKSTVANFIKLGILAEDPTQTVSIRSTDDLFYVDGKYTFQQEKLGGFHMKNLYLAEEDCKVGINHILIDNTNIKARDCKGYILLAKKYGYSITTIKVDAGLIEAKKRNAARTPDKQIPEHVIERMAGDFQEIKLDDPKC